MATKRRGWAGVPSQFDQSKGVDNPSRWRRATQSQADLVGLRTASSRRGWFRGLVIAATTALLLSACGGSATPTKSVLAQVIERGTLRVAVIVPNPTFAEPDASGNLIGYEADIANLLGQALGVKVEFIQTDAPGRVTLVQTGKADVAIATFTRNLERMKVINFTDPLFLESVVLITTPDKTDLNKVSDFNKAGLKIAILTGGTQVEAVKSVLPNAEGVAFPGLDDLVQALLSGQVDAATTGNVGIGPLMKAHPGKLKPVEGNLTPPQDDGIGVAQGDFAWWNYVNTFVHQIHADGTTYTLWQKYLGEGSPGPFSIPPAGTD